MRNIGYILSMLVILHIVGCAEDDTALMYPDGTFAVSFSGNALQVTRADITGAAAAADLDSNFIVAGYKIIEEDGVTETIQMIDHYHVNYKDGTAHSTPSNTSGWEYVGETVPEDSRLRGPTALAPQSKQTIKYWDNSADSHYFIAFSKGLGVYTQNVDSVTFAPIGTPVWSYARFTAVRDTTVSDVTYPMYTAWGDVNDLAAAYYADIVSVSKANYRSATVTPRFRRIGAKIRIGLYETIPGYSVSDVQFYCADMVKLTKPALYVDEELFPQGIGVETISYPNFNNTGTANQYEASVGFAALSAVSNVNYIYFNPLRYGPRENKERDADNKYLGRTSATATYPGPGEPSEAYTDVLPPSGGSMLLPLKLKADYTLIPTDGAGEKIHVHGATAIVPQEYANWLPNHAYTYIFRISDNTNGITDRDHPGAEGLYPMTLDAVVQTDVNGYMETVTTISGPSITTYQKGSSITTNGTNIYEAGKPVYVVVYDNGSVVLVEGSGDGQNTNLYQVGISEEVNPIEVSETIVSDCFSNAGVDEYYTFDTGKQIKLTLINDKFDDRQTQIPASDSPNGKDVPVNCGRVAVEANVLYAVQYKTSDGTYRYKVFNVGEPTRFEYVDITHPETNWGDAESKKIE